VSSTVLLLLPLAGRESGHAEARCLLRRCRVRAARRAAARRTRGPFVRTARRAAARRAEAGLRRAAPRACFESARLEAAARPSRFNARRTAVDRRREGFRERRRPARLAAAALCRVLRGALAGGRPSFTPERRAFDSPMAIACFVDRAPCLPSRT
jgi:hypothetical protein